MQYINYNSNAFFICENQSIEKSLIYNWKKKSKNKIFAIQNSTVRFWDLRYSEFSDKSLIQKKQLNLLYDKLLINGEISNKILINNQYYSKYIDKVEAFRYEPFFNIKTNFKNKLDKSNLKILIVGDAADYINLNLLDYFLKYNQSRYNLKIYFKPHPLSNLHLRSKYSTFLIENNTLINCSNKYDYFVTSNTTSASLDLIFLQVNLFVMLDSKIPNFSPVRKFSEVKFFNQFDNFKNILIETKFKHSNLISNSLYYSPDYKFFTKYIYD